MKKILFFGVSVFIILLLLLLLLLVLILLGSFESKEVLLVLIFDLSLNSLAVWEFRTS